LSQHCEERHNDIRQFTDIIYTAEGNKNSSVDEIANVNFYAVRPEDTRIR